MTYTKDLVSVIIPTYNQERFIAETLESVINQTYQNLEIIVMDDGSTDSNPDVIKEYAKQDTRITPILSSKNEGFSANVNKGLEAAKGEFIAKLDGDDIMMPDKIQRQVDFLKSNPEYVLICHDMEVFDSDSGRTLHRLSERGILAASMEEWALFTNWWFTKPPVYWVYSSVLARTKYLTQTLWDVRVPYKNEILHMIGNQYSLPGKWKLIDEPLGRYRYFPNSMSRTRRDPNFKIEEAYVCFSLAAIKYPQHARKIVRAKKYNLFRHILTGENIEKRKFIFLYFKEYGFFSWLFLSLMDLLLKTRLIFLLNKPFRVYYKKKYGIA